MKSNEAGLNITVLNKMEEEKSLQKNETFDWEIESIDGLGEYLIKNQDNEEKNQTEQNRTSSDDKSTKEEDSSNNTSNSSLKETKN